MEEAKTTESMDNKFKELLEEKPIFHVLENYTYYRKMLDEVNGTTPINALADTKASDSVMHYKLYKVLGLGKACPSNDKLLMADKTIAKAYGNVRNMRLQIGFQAYNGSGIMMVDDGVVKHIYHAKKRNKIVADEDSDEED
ncbi:agenet domain-containing protein [Tanacetum coccineum]